MILSNATRRSLLQRIATNTILYTLYRDCVELFCDTVIKYNYRDQSVHIIDIDTDFISAEKLLSIREYDPKNHKPIAIIVSVKLSKISTIFCDFKHTSTDIKDFIATTEQEQITINHYYKYIYENM